MTSGQLFCSYTSANHLGIIRGILRQLPNAFIKAKIGKNLKTLVLGTENHIQTAEQTCPIACCEVCFQPDVQIKRHSRNVLLFSSKLCMFPSNES